MQTLQKPTIEFYSYLQDAFDFFNKHLYANSLSSVVFTITRKKNTTGFFREDGWQTEDNKKIHEIAINPNFFITSSPLEVYQTLVHEMAHQWQAEHGMNRPRKNYHNKEWANKMRSIGLEPISKNGKGTGQKVGDKPISGGVFEGVCRQFFIEGYKLPFVDSSSANAEMLKKYNSIIEQRVEAYKKANANQGENKDLSNPDVSQNDNPVSGLLKPDESKNQSAYDFIDLSQPMSEIYTIKEITQPTQHNHSTKTTYKCPNCGYKVWGAANLPIGCLDCHTTLMVVSKNT